jgi:hypothetical protein
MRLIPFSIVILIAHFSSTSLAQQAPPTPTPPQSQPTLPGYTGGPPGPLTPYYTGQVPEVFSPTGRSIPGPNFTTLIVKAVPCTVASQWTDGTTTCVGIPDSFRKSAR